MLALIPVYTDQNGIHDVAIFQENEDGSFSRTPEQPLRQLRENIVGVSNPIGTLITQRYDRSERPWDTPTALPYSGRPRSFYTFVRENLQKRRIIVATVQSSQGKSIKLFLNELKLRPSMGQGSIKLFMRKYLEATHLWQEAAEKAPTTVPTTEPVATPETPSAEEHTPKPADEEEKPATETEEEKPASPVEKEQSMPVVETKEDNGKVVADSASKKAICKDRMAGMSEAEIAKIKRLRKVFGR